MGSGGQEVEAGSFSGDAGLARLKRAAASTAAVRTMKMEMRISIDAPGMDGSSTVSGEVDTANRRAHMVMDMGGLLGRKGPAGLAKTETIVDDGHIYLSASSLGPLLHTDKPWVRLEVKALESAGPGLTGGNVDPTGTLKVLDGMADLHTVGTEDVRGVRTTHVAGTLDFAKLVRSQPAGRKVLEAGLGNVGPLLDRISELPAEVWVDADGQVRRMELRFDMGAIADEDELDGAEMVEVIDLYDFGEPVDITVPPASQVDDIDPTDLLGD